MILRKTLIASLLLITLFLGTSYAQQDAQYTQYMYNTMSVNPAYAGSRGQFSAALLYRNQWLGQDGAPTTATLNLHSPIRESKVGYGLSIVQDEIGEGIVRETYIDGAVSYTIDVAKDAKLSFGLKLGAKLFDLDVERLRQREDPRFREDVMTDNIDNRFAPNIGLGIYYHTNKFYAGLSAPNLLETEHFDGSNSSEGDISFLAKERINFYLITGYVFDLGSNLKFKPAVLSKVVSGAPLQLDFSGTFLINDNISVGAAYRWDAAASALVGFQLSDQFMIGLAYDRETSDFGAARFNDGSFEIFLRYELIKSFKKLVSPRFF